MDEQIPLSLWLTFDENIQKTLVKKLSLLIHQKLDLLFKFLNYPAWVASGVR